MDETSERDFTPAELEIVSEKILKFFKTQPRGVFNHQIPDGVDCPPYMKSKAYGLLYVLDLIMAHPYRTGWILITPKGKKFKSFKRERLKQWYRELPAKNWLLAEVLKFSTTTIIGLSAGFIGGILAMQLYPQHNQQSKSETVKEVIQKESYQLDSAHQKKK